MATTVDMETGEIHETDDDDDEAAQADEDEQALRQAAEQEGSAEVAAKLTKENERHIKAVGKILDRDMESDLCPTCDGFGFADAEQKAQAASELPADFVQPEGYVACDACNGYGEIISGSKNPAHAIVICTRCNALGYRIEQTAPAPVYPPQVPAPTEPQPQNGVYVPGRGFIPYGATEPIPGTA